MYKQCSLWQGDHTENVQWCAFLLNPGRANHWLFLSTANPPAQNQHLSPASQTFLLPIPITSVDTDSPPPLLLALKTSLAFISPNSNLPVVLWFRHRQWQQLSDETTAGGGNVAPCREAWRAALDGPVSRMVMAERRSLYVIYMYLSIIICPGKNTQCSFKL